MKNVLLLNKIAACGTNQFDAAEYQLTDACENPELIMVRSAAMHDMPVGDKLMAVARAGAGVNNIPVDDYAKKGIVVFNTPGANANGVKELAIAALLLASRDIVGGVQWASTLAGTEAPEKAVEKGKSKFAGIELQGKTLGVIGLGAIGGLVANAAVSLGMDVIGYDPYVSVEAAWRISRKVRKAADYAEIYRESDFISIHVPATPTTKGMINADTIAQMKDGVRLINLARADLVNATDVKAALESGKVASYVTDFPTAETIGVKGIVTIPHLGASTEESEENCARMAALELIDFAENGNIKNSVNFPTLCVDRGDCARIGVLHENIPAVISGITTVVANFHLNIEHLTCNNRGDKGYAIIDVHGEIPAELPAKIGEIEGVIRTLTFEGK